MTPANRKTAAFHIERGKKIPGATLGVYSLEEDWMDTDKYEVKWIDIWNHKGSVFHPGPNRKDTTNNKWNSLNLCKEKQQQQQQRRKRDLFY